MASAKSPGVELIEISVVYSAAPRVVAQVTLTVACGTTVLQAVLLSGLMERYPAVCLDQVAVGVWGKVVAWGHSVAAGDRIELYRPLTVDPKEARRQRYRAQGERGRRQPGRRA